MKTERELWLKCVKHCIENDIIGFHLMFDVFLEMREREGYKLVPVEKLEELKRDADRMISSAHLYQDECHIKSFGRSFLHNYKDMIGVVE